MFIMSENYLIDPLSPKKKKKKIIIYFNELLLNVIT